MTSDAQVIAYSVLIGAGTGVVLYAIVLLIKGPPR